MGDQVKMPDGTIVEMPDELTPEMAARLKKMQTEYKAKKSHSSEEYEAPKQPSEATITSYKNPAYSREQKVEMARREEAGRKEMSKIADEGVLKGAAGIGESGLSAVSGLASSAVGGLLGGARATWSLLSGEGLDAAATKGAETAEKIQKKGTYVPRTAMGQAVTGLAGDVGKVPTEMASKAGGVVGGEIGEAMGGEEGRLRGENIGRSVGEVAPAAVATKQGLNQVRASMKEAASRERAPVPGKDVTPLRELTPEQQERMSRMTDQGVKPTLGQVTREPTQYRFEERTAKRPEGEALHQRNMDTNDALIKVIEDTDKLRAGKKSTENRRETGANLAQALEEKRNASLAEVGEKYKAAKESGETKKVVNAKALDDYLEKTVYRRKAVTALDAVASQLDDMKKRKNGKLTIDDMEELYKTANELANPNDASFRHMRDVKKLINQVTEGQGGDLYREARKSRLEHGLEFEDRKAIADLVEKRTGSRTDYKTQAEDVVNKVLLNSSLEELKDVTTSLLNGKHANEKTAQAVRNLQGEAIDHLLEKGGVVGDLASGMKNERGVGVLDARAFRKAVKEIGKDKLEYLLGPEAMDRLYKAAKTGREVKEAPVKGSFGDAALAGMDLKDAAMDAAKSTLLSRIPGVRYIAPFIEERQKAKMTQERVTEALHPRRASPEEIRKQAADVKRKERQFRMSEDSRAAGAAMPAAVAPLLKQKEEENQ